MMQAEEEMNQEVPVENVCQLSLSNTVSSRSPLSSPTTPVLMPPGTLGLASPCNGITSSFASTPSTSTHSSQQVAVPVLDHNWQANKASVRERNAVMFNNELMADIHFVVGHGSGAVRIPAHKYTLATGSSVFYAMFYGQLADSDKDIKIPDVEPSAFLNLLRLVW